jgi:hypothetical protein
MVIGDAQFPMRSMTAVFQRDGLKGTNILRKIGIFASPHHSCRFRVAKISQGFPMTTGEQCRQYLRMQHGNRILNIAFLVNQVLWMTT